MQLGGMPLSTFLMERRPVGFLRLAAGFVLDRLVIRQGRFDAEKSEKEQ